MERHDPRPLHIRFLDVLSDGVPRSGWDIVHTFPDADEIFRSGDVHQTSNWLLKQGFVTNRNSVTHGIYNYTITERGRNELQEYMYGKVNTRV